ncbi:MAG: hypothetical protein CMJ18_11550 [Phycisphaeraceae bacterium]|nr:hypothetical protein [Phycisphaeraceae bacterium]
MAELKASQDGDWLDQRRAEEVKTLIRDVLADAETRASLMEGGATAGHNGESFFLASDDGGFLLKIQGLLQMRYVASFQDRESLSEDEISEIAGEFGDLEDFVASALSDGVVDDEGEFGMEIPRAKIIFSGHIADPRLQYVIEFVVDFNDNSVLGDWMTISYELMDGVTAWIGEDKIPFLREEITQPWNLQAVDRSYMNEFFTMGVGQGVGVMIAGDVVFNAPVNLHVMINDGFRSGDGSTAVNPFTQSGFSQIDADEDGLPIVDDPDLISTLSDLVSVSSSGKLFDRDRSDFAITARVDVKLMGDWDQMADFAAWGGEDTAAFIGAAIHWEVGETGDSAYNNNFFSWTIDGSMECSGWNLYGAVVGHHTDLEDEDSVVASEYDLYGAVIQGGYMIPNTDWEPFVRYEYLDFDDALGFGSSAYDELSIVTVGANYYMAKHNAKITVDLMWALDAVPAASTQIGLQADDPDGEDQVVVRAQIQLFF